MRAASKTGLLVALVATTIGLAACRKPDPAATKLTSAQQPQSAPIKVRTTTVVEQPMPEYLTLTGSLRASQESEVAANATGKVSSTLVERGQQVKQGDPLVILDARATPGMALRMETVRSLTEELFLLQTLGDDRAVTQVYVAGRAAKEG